MKYKLTIDGKTYEVDVEASAPDSTPKAYYPPMTNADRSAATTPRGETSTPQGSPVADESKVCRSPIAGVAVKVSAQAGQSIQANDVLVVLEAMKMETTITSPVAGQVKKVCVAVGDPVQGGQVVVEFE